MALAREIVVRPQDWIVVTSDSRDDAFSTYDPAAVVALLDSFLSDDGESPENLQASLVALMDAIDEDRVGARRIFPTR